MKPHPMSSYDARRATFYPSDEQAKSRSKKANPVWPHAIAQADGVGPPSDKDGMSVPTPKELATFGLYFDPSAARDASDSCVLYPEASVVAHWKAGDDVRQRIRDVEPHAAILLINESKEAGQKKGVGRSWTWARQELLPTNKMMSEARLRTFASSWPYDGKKGWKPTSKKLSQAGFHYTPNDEEEDCATCCYCECALGGWEKTDDPVEEHQRRRPECPFFNCSVHPVTDSTKARSGSVSVKRGRAVSKRKNKEDVEEEQANAEEAQMTDAKPAAESSVEERAQPKSRSTSRAKKQAKANVEEASGSEGTKQATRGRNASRKAAPDDIASPASKTVLEHAVVTSDGEGDMAEVEQTDKEVKDTEQAADPEAEAKVVITPVRGERAPEQQTPVVGVNNETADQAGREVETSEPVRHLEVTKALTGEMMPTHELAKRPSQPAPFSITPLTELDKLTPAEESMTVEAWLKMQVSRACEEMEREGMHRIERLREEISKGRAEIESALRGTSKA